MPRKPGRPCSAPSCSAIVHGRDRYCPEHKHLETRRHRRYEERTGRPSASERGYDADFARVRQQVLERRGRRCQRCGGVGDIVHHVIALKQGGARLDPANMLVVCPACHQVLHG